MRFINSLFILLFKSVISSRDVTFGIRAKVFKMIFGVFGAELIVLHFPDCLIRFMLIFGLYNHDLSCLV